jgi:hypothetical protein
MGTGHSTMIQLGPSRITPSAEINHSRYQRRPHPQAQAMRSRWSRFGVGGGVQTWDSKNGATAATVASPGDGRARGTLAGVQCQGCVRTSRFSRDDTLQGS